MPLSSIYIPKNVFYNAQLMLFSHLFFPTILDSHKLSHIMFTIISTKFTNEFPLFRNRKQYYSRHDIFHYCSLVSLHKIKVQRFVPTKQKAKPVLSIMLIFNVLGSRDKSIWNLSKYHITHNSCETRITTCSQNLWNVRALGQWKSKTHLL